MWVKFGGFGRQIALVRSILTETKFSVWKWRENSRRWVGPITHSSLEPLVVGPLSEDDRKSAMFHRAHEQISAQLGLTVRP